MLDYDDLVIGRYYIYNPEKNINDLPKEVADSIAADKIGQRFIYIEQNEYSDSERYRSFKDIKGVEHGFHPGEMEECPRKSHLPEWW